MKIYKSCNAKISDKEFELQHTSGLTSYVSFERLMRNTITNAIGLKQNESIKGMAIDSNGITFYLETVPIGTANHSLVP